MMQFQFVRSDKPPLQQGILRIGFQMRLEHALDIGTDRNRLHRIVQQIANHTNVTCMRQLDDHCEVRTVLPARDMRGGARRAPS
jgi:hypothetical protein